MAIFHFLPTPPTTQVISIPRDEIVLSTTSLINTQFLLERSNKKLNKTKAFEDCYYDKRNLQKSAGIKMSKSFPLSGTSLASLESLSLPLVQEVVLSADMQCETCQKRVADIITKMNAETQSIVVNVLEKKVILTFRISKTTVGKLISKKVTPLNKTPSPKVAIIKRIFRSSSG